jgi:glutathione S-transferase
VKLYCGIGPNSYRVRIFMAEKGIDMPKVEIDLMAGEHKRPEFLKLNSLGQIPVLQLDDGKILTESVAICRYLEELHPTPALFGRTAFEKGLVEMWNRRVEIELFGTVGNVALHSDPLFAERLTQFPEFAKTERERAPTKWAWLDREMADGRPFIAGDFYSVADITAGVVAWLGDFFGIEMPRDIPHVKAWLERVHARPGWEQ